MDLEKYRQVVRAAIQNEIKAKKFYEIYYNTTLSTTSSCPPPIMWDHRPYLPWPCRTIRTWSRSF